MKALTRKQIFLILGAWLLVSAGFLAHMSTSGMFDGCGSEGDGNPHLGQVSSMHITAPVYLFVNSGRFLKGNVSTDEWVEISNHGFESAPSAATSGDGRWISYSGRRKDGSGEQYWLYDKVSGSDRLYHQHPDWGIGSVKFSPDNKTIAVFSNYDPRWPSAEAAGIYLIDVDTLTPRRLENPLPTSIPVEKTWGWGDWSKDGSELLVTVRAWERGAYDLREHFAYHVAEKRFEPIEGEHASRGEKYIRHGTRLEVFEQRGIQSHHHVGESASPDGKWTASIGWTLGLSVSAKGYPTRKAAQGRLDSCSGETIHIVGWIDANHLVYSLDREFYVFDAEAGYNAYLFSGDNHSLFFDW